MQQIRLHGRGGQGAVSGAYMLGYSAFLEGKKSQAFPSFGVERTGAPVEAFVRISDEVIRTKQHIYNPDFLIIQDDTLINIDSVWAGTDENTVAILNTDKVPENPIPFRGKLYIMDMKPIAMKTLGKPIYNTAMLAMFAKICGCIKLDSLKLAAEKQLPPHLLQANIDLLENVYDATPCCEVEYQQGEIKAKEEKMVEVNQTSPACSTKVNKTGDWGVQYPALDKEKCIKCGRCKMFCPDNCIAHEMGLIPEFDLDYCKGCGLCSKVCPVKAIEMKSKFTKENE